MQKQIVIALSVFALMLSCVPTPVDPKPGDKDTIPQPDTTIVDPVDSN